MSCHSTAPTAWLRLDQLTNVIVGVCSRIAIPPHLTTIYPLPRYRYIYNNPFAHAAHIPWKSRHCTRSPILGSHGVFWCTCPSPVDAPPATRDSSLSIGFRCTILTTLVILTIFWILYCYKSYTPGVYCFILVPGVNTYNIY